MWIAPTRPLQTDPKTSIYSTQTTNFQSRKFKDSTALLSVTKTRNWRPLFPKCRSRKDATSMYTSWALRFKKSYFPVLAPNSTLSCCHQPPIKEEVSSISTNNSRALNPTSAIVKSNTGLVRNLKTFPPTATTPTRRSPRTPQASFRSNNSLDLPWREDPKEKDREVSVCVRPSPRAATTAVRAGRLDYRGSSFRTIKARRHHRITAWASCSTRRLPRWKLSLRRGK